MHRRSQGFSPLEIILAIAVIGLIGAVVWIFISNQNANTANVQPTSKESDKKKSIDTSDKTTNEIAKNKSENWLAWQPSGKQYSIKFADGWSVHLKEKNGASFYTYGSLNQKPGIQAKVSDETPYANAPLEMQACTDDKNGAVVLDYMNYTFPAKWYTGKETTMKTNGGLDIKKSVKLPYKGNDGVHTNYTSYSYVISTTNKSVMINYTACEDATDNHELVEEVIKTFEF